MIRKYRLTDEKGDVMAYGELSPADELRIPDVGKPGWVMVIEPEQEAPAEQEWLRN
jgi:hypothetical protein